MVKVGKVIEVFVCRSRIEISYVFIRFKFKFTNFVIVLLYPEICALDKSMKITQAAFYTEAVPPFLQILEVNFVGFDWDAVPPAIERVIQNQPASSREPTRAAAECASARVRIQDRAERRVVVVCFLRAPVCEDQKLIESILESGAAASLPIV